MKQMKTTFDEHNFEIPKGAVHILMDRCKGCGYCIEYCPQKVLALSGEVNDQGYHFPRVLDGDACVNCGLCEMICPVFAIWSTLDGYVRPSFGKVSCDDGNE